MRRLYILLSWRFSGISKLEREDFSRKLFNSFKQIFKLKAFSTDMVGFMQFHQLNLQKIKHLR